MLQCINTFHEAVDRGCFGQQLRKLLHPANLWASRIKTRSPVEPQLLKFHPAYFNTCSSIYFTSASATAELLHRLSGAHAAWIEIRIGFVITFNKRSGICVVGGGALTAGPCLKRRGGEHLYEATFFYSRSSHFTLPQVAFVYITSEFITILWGYMSLISF